MQKKDRSEKGDKIGVFKQAEPDEICPRVHQQLAKQPLNHLQLSFRNWEGQERS